METDASRCLLSGRRPLGIVQVLFRQLLNGEITIILNVHPRKLLLLLYLPWSRQWTAQRRMKIYSLTLTEQLSYNRTFAEVMAPGMTDCDIDVDGAGLHTQTDLPGIDTARSGGGIGAALSVL